MSNEFSNFPKQKVLVIHICINRPSSPKAKKIT